MGYGEPRAPGILWPLVKQIRALREPPSSPHETRGASVIRPVVFGATDGLIANLSLIMGVAAVAREDPTQSSWLASPVSWRAGSAWRWASTSRFGRSGNCSTIRWSSSAISSCTRPRRSDPSFAGSTRRRGCRGRRPTSSWAGSSQILSARSKPSCKRKLAFRRRRWAHRYRQGWGPSWRSSSGRSSRSCPTCSSRWYWPSRPHNPIACVNGNPRPVALDVLHDRHDSFMQSEHEARFRNSQRISQRRLEATILRNYPSSGSPPFHLSERGRRGGPGPSRRKRQSPLRPSREPRCQ